MPKSCGRILTSSWHMSTACRSIGLGRAAAELVGGVAVAVPPPEPVADGRVGRSVPFPAVAVPASVVEHPDPTMISTATSSPASGATGSGIDLRMRARYRTDTHRESRTYDVVSW